MGTIEIEGMEFYAYHGCFAEEQIVGNKFMVDLRLEANCAKAKISDNINDAVNYQTAYEIVKTEVISKFGRYRRCNRKNSKNKSSIRGQNQECKCSFDEIKY
jgi:dihydroneopterin aldolase